jgi:hypothetical protein
MLFHSAQRRHHYLGGRCPTTCCMRSDGRKWAQHKSDRNDILKASFNTLVGSMRRRCQARIDGGELLFCGFFYTHAFECCYHEHIQLNEIVIM